MSGNGVTSGFGAGAGDGVVLIIGAGPAGLTAAHALAVRGVRPLVLESDTAVGGISKTIEHAGNRMDIGGHRFFSKSSRVMDYWLDILPLEGTPDTAPDAPSAVLSPETSDAVMLNRSRLSRIYFLRKLFDYPISLTAKTLAGLGLVRTARIGLSYCAARVRPRQERSLEDFMVNRFGRTLYEMFFRDYTEKVWGVPCSEIPPDWGAQRLKGLSMSKAIIHALTQPFRREGGIRQTGVETSLIDRFLYPKLGPGQLWTAVADRVRELGGEVLLESEVVAIHIDGDRVTGVTVADRATGSARRIPVAAVLSSMPIRDLVMRIDDQSSVPENVRQVAEGLPYRDFITCGLLVSRLGIEEPGGGPLRDNWIYIQESDVRLGRVQVFNNWSPYLTSSPDRWWVGLEYFANEGDEMWSMPDDEFVQFAIEEAAKIGLLRAEDVLDGTVLHVQKAYPAYFGTYARFGEIRDWVDGVQNLYLMGRNGTHRYNNMDHSMLSAWAAVDALLGEGKRAAIWSVNAEDSYHEDAA